MAIPPEATGSPVEVTHETLQAAASDTLPEQRNALGNTKQTVTARQVPAEAFSELGAEASDGHNRNITQIADRMTGADKQYAAVIQGIGDTTKQFQEFDEDQAGRQKDENVQLAAAQKKQQATSQNGWPVNPSRSWRTVPGSGVRLNLADGPSGDLLNHVAGQVHQRVESINLEGNDGPDDWGYANRPIRGSSTTSNHASGTAFDFNADLHPLGAANTWTPAQVDKIHTILGEVDNVVRWGGDYHGRLDEMHFEIVGTPAEVSRVWDRIRLEIERTP
jgi:D-alanyl-D-alanine carboxypeptidase-like protein